MKWNLLGWSDLTTLNVPAHKSVITMRLWIGTGVAFGIIAIISTVWSFDPPETFAGLWLGALAALSGVNYFSQKNQRETDYGYVERQVEIEKAKATAAASPPPPPGQADPTIGKIADNT